MSAAILWSAYTRFQANYTKEDHKTYPHIHIRVRGEPSERLIPSLGVEMGLGGSKFFIIFIIFMIFMIFIISFAGPRAGPLYFDTQAPRRPRPTRKITPRLGLEVLLVKHQDLAVAGGC